MSCRLVFAFILVGISVTPTYGENPQLTETGVLVTEAVSRGRVGGDGFI